MLPFNGWIRELSLNFGIYQLITNALVLQLAVFFPRKRVTRVERRALSLISLLCFFFHAAPLIRLYLPSDRGLVHDFRPQEAIKVLLVSGTVPRNFPLLSAVDLTVATGGLTAPDSPYLVTSPHGAQISSSRPLWLNPVTGELDGALLAELTLRSGKKLEVAVFSAPPVLSGEAFARTRIAARRLSTIVRHDEKDLLLFTSMHSTPASWLYGAVAHSMRVEDAAQGFGVFKTWKAGNPVVALNLDQAFVRGGFRVVSYETRPVPGSGHLALLLELAFAQ